MPGRSVAALTAALALLAACHHRGTLDATRVIEESGARLAPVSAEARRQYLRRARIFDDGDIASRDLLRGPEDAHAFVFDSTASCDFIEPRPDRVPVGGSTPKFFCTLRHGHGHADVKVKYGRDNRETYGEMLGSRLLWALGVAVDHDYAARVRCHGCPVEPWHAYRLFPKPDTSPRATREYDDAVLQRLYPGVPIEECTRADGDRCVQHRADQGWSFAELDLVDAAAGGASRAEVDALRLLAAFIAHGDDKPDNQRLICPFDAIDGGGRCTAPRLLVADLGSTFGRGASRIGFIDRDARPTFAAWSTLPLWEDAAACRAHLQARVGPSHPTVSEAGRRLLAERLMRLTEKQIRDLFFGARIEALGETHVVDGTSRPVTVDDWVDAFHRRRAALVDHHCDG
jgi:hypothetical protein